MQLYNNALKESFDILTAKQKIYSVYEVCQMISSMFQNYKPLQSIYVCGEITEYKMHASGHIYFTLRDSENSEKCILKACIWKSNRPTIDLINGLQVKCIGDIKPYLDGSNYSFHIRIIEIFGAGVLLEQLEILKSKLQREGLFNIERKKKIPRIPRVIGIITADESDAYKDVVKKQLSERFVGTVVLKSVAVQGRSCPVQVIQAIETMNQIHGAMRPNVIIITRGGGSFEDLWHFNNEEMVRAVANSSIPIISAIGHENDAPLIDLAADFRAATPTEAGIKVAKSRAEILELANLQVRVIRELIISLVGKYQETYYILKPLLTNDVLFQKLEKDIQRIRYTIHYIMMRLLERYIHKIDAIRYLERNNLRAIKRELEALVKQTKAQRNTLRDVLCYLVKDQQTKLHSITKLLDSYNPGRPLENGFAMLRINDQLINSIADLKSAIGNYNTKIDIEMHDGKLCIYSRLNAS